ncbi:MAG: hypothetical protein J6A89_02960 [Clostridia bacterium]|nr:hypothetical protein [Clostridia bacterium]
MNKYKMITICSLSIVCILILSLLLPLKTIANDKESIELKMHYESSKVSINITVNSESYTGVVCKYIEVDNVLTYDDLSVQTKDNGTLLNLNKTEGDNYNTTIENVSKRYVVIYVSIGNCDICDYIDCKANNSQEASNNSQEENNNSEETNNNSKENSQDINNTEKTQENTESESTKTEENKSEEVKNENTNIEESENSDNQNQNTENNNDKTQNNENNNNDSEDNKENDNKSENKEENNATTNESNKTENFEDFENIEEIPVANQTPKENSTQTNNNENKEPEKQETNNNQNKEPEKQETNQSNNNENKKQQTSSNTQNPIKLQNYNKESTSLNKDNINPDSFEEIQSVEKTSSNANTQIPQTGEDDFLKIIGIVIFSAISIISFYKYQKTK